MDNKIKDYLIANQEHFKKLTENSRIRKEYLLSIDSLFTEEIIIHYNNNIQSIIVDELTKNLAVDFESVIVVLESIDLNEYLS